VSKLLTLDEPPDMVYELVPSLIMWIVEPCAAAGSIIGMIVGAITIAAAIMAMTYVLDIVIPNSRVHNEFKRKVRKFEICLDKKLKVDYLFLIDT
jgi:hypothetical protein